jgi:hypothetical protein
MCAVDWGTFAARGEHPALPAANIETVTAVAMNRFFTGHPHSSSAYRLPLSPLRFFYQSCGCLRGETSPVVGGNAIELTRS